MKTIPGIYTTDEVAKDLTRISLAALEDIAWTNVSGVPFRIAHDFHRIIGWNKIIGLYITHKTSYMIGNSFIPENEEESLQVLNLAKNFYLKSQLEKIKEFDTTFLDLLKNKRILGKDFIWLYNGLLMYQRTDILNEVFPKIKQLMDDDNLVSLESILKDFDYVDSGIFKDKKSDLAILLHPFFRRSFSRLNNYNTSFLELLYKAFKNGNKSVKLRLDPDVIGYSPSYKPVLEHDYWYGPSYSDDISNIKPGLCHLENDEENRLYNNIKFSEFIWQKKDNNKKFQFEMEEVMNSPSISLGKGQCGCRYLHSLYDIQEKEFNHFDGAIRIYDEEQIKERLLCSMDKMGHVAQYQKVFRIDGKVPLNLWKSLITQYLRSNPLIYDYFNEKRPDIRERTQDNYIDDIYKYVPYEINKGDGVKLLISYQDVPEIHQDASRQFLLKDKILLNEGKNDYIADFAIVDLYEVLNSIGAPIELPETLFYIVDDHYNNIPTIYHSPENLEKNLSKTLEGIRKIISQHVENGDDERYSFSLSWIISKKLVTISFMGHVEDINKWLLSFKTIPVIRDRLKQWIEQQGAYIYNHEGYTKTPIYISHIMDDGILLFKRHNVNEHICLSSNLDSIESIEDFCRNKCENKSLHDKILSHTLKVLPMYICSNLSAAKYFNSYLYTLSLPTISETNDEFHYVFRGYQWSLDQRCIAHDNNKKSLI